MDQPFVSVLLPVLNEEKFLHKSLGAVLAQDYPHLEVLVIDGASEDRTVEIIQKFQQRDHRVRLLHNPGRWQVRALNIGVKAALGEIIVRVDGHTLIAPDYVRRAVDHLLHDGADNVGGLQKAVGISKMGQAIAAANRSRFGVPSPFKVAKQDMLVDTVFLGAWRRDLFERVGFWNENYRVNEDYEHNFRIRQAGGKILLAMDMHSDYYCRDNLPALWRQYYQYGYGKIKMLAEHPSALKPRQAAAPIFVAALAGGGILGILFKSVRFLWVLMIGLYTVMAILESLRQSKGDSSLSWRLPLVFATIYTAWGLGFWRGLGEIVFERKTP